MMDSWVNADPPLTLKDRARLVTDRDFRNEVAERIVARACERFPEVGYTSNPGWRTRRSMRKRARELARLAHLYGGYPTFAATPTRHRDVEVKVLDRQSAAVRGGTDHLTHAIRTAARAAQRKIRIHNPYVTLSEDAIAALETAGRRGVEIELLTNSPASSDNRLTQGFFLEDWPRLAARIPNLRIFVTAGGRKLHAKSIEVDDRMTFVKSYNLDLLSERVNSELGIVAWSESFAKDAGECFERDRRDVDQNVLEYRIARHPDGRPRLDDRGEPIVEFGAKHHIPKWTWRKMKLFRWGVRMLRKLPGMSRHQRPALR
jgi:phosphatidylserine/phosphatidylglycerophosphate/cardiolipin synthase-like enzyme